MSAPMQKLIQVCHLCKRQYFIYKQRRANHSFNKSQKWKGVIGLEIHAQINTESKLFSGAEKNFGSPTNSNVSLFDAAFPGTLPVLNKECVEAGVLTALALRCNINKVSKFDRKHYFYADLPAGYQITQQRQPLAVRGHVDYCITDKNSYQKKTANIIQLQLEQDSGKSLHDEMERQSLIDLNRCGTGLMEIVTEPDFSNGMDAAAFVKELQLILERINTCNCKMEEGSLRVDANISVHKPGDPLGVRTEVKNLNSVRSLSKAIDFEVKRQIKVLENSGSVENETRSFDTESGETVPMRDKEIKQDYRFMPEPNLPPLCLFDNESISTASCNTSVINIDDIRNKLPPLPEDIRQRLEKNYNIPRQNAAFLTEIKGMLEYFEDVMNSSSTRSGKKVSNLMLNQLLGILNEKKMTMDKCPITSENFGRLIDMLQQEEISHTIGTKVLVEMIDQADTSPEEVVDKNDWRQVNDKEYLQTVSRKVLDDNPKLVKQYQKGKMKYLHALTSKAVEATQDKGNPRILMKIVESMLKQ